MAGRRARYIQETAPIIIITFGVRSPFAEILQKLCGAQGFWENVLDSFSCFYIRVFPIFYLRLD